MEESLVSIDVHDESRVESVSQKMYLFLRTVRQFADVGWMNFDCWICKRRTYTYTFFSRSVDRGRWLIGYSPLHIRTWSFPGDHPHSRNELDSPKNHEPINSSNDKPTPPSVFFSISLSPFFVSYIHSQNKQAVTELYDCYSNVELYCIFNCSRLMHHPNPRMA